MRIGDTAKLEVYKKQHQEIKKNTEIKEEKHKKVKVPEDKVDISLLLEESEAASAHLRRIIEDLLRRQGIEIGKLGELKSEDVKVDQKARDEAKQMIEEGGPLSAESVSDRIVDFAKAISDGDKSRLSVLRDAIDQGFEEAKDFFGGELPEISTQTYDLIQEKLDAWESEE